MKKTFSTILLTLLLGAFAAARRQHDGSCAGKYIAAWVAKNSAESQRVGVINE